MHELQRQVYLQAIGVESYISRRQLPGAAVTRRIAIVRRDGQTSLPPPAVAPVTATKTKTKTDTTPARRPAMPDFDFDTASEPASRESVASIARDKASGEAPAIQLRFATIVCGEYLWVEDLADRALASEQVGLVQGMAQALAVASSGEGRPDLVASPLIAQFDWPMHNNRQLDNSEEAARAGLAAFIGRRLEQHGCKGLVVLGAGCQPWVVSADLTVPVVATTGSAEMLAQPLRKADAWRDLVAFVGRA